MKKVIIFILFIFQLICKENMELWNGNDYDENSQLQKTIANNFLAIVYQKFSALKPNSILLDIGCGNGKITRSLLNNFPGITIVGIDSSADMIGFANEHYSNEKVSFYIDKAEELKTITEESIDAITSFSCLHWVKDQYSAFKKMYDALKPGGWMSLMFAAETGFDDPIDHAYAQAINEDTYKKYFLHYTSDVEWYIAKPDNINNKLSEIGFNVIYMDTQNFNYYFRDAESFKNWVLATFQQLKLLPTKKLREDCARRIVDLYLQATKQNINEKCYYQVDAFMVMAIKLNNN